MKTSYKLVVSFLAVILIAGGFMFNSERKSEVLVKNQELSAVNELKKGCLSWKRDIGLKVFMKSLESSDLEDKSRIFMSITAAGHFEKAGQLEIRFSEISTFAIQMLYANGIDPMNYANDIDPYEVIAGSSLPVKPLLISNLSKISKVCEKHGVRIG